MLCCDVRSLQRALGVLWRSDDIFGTLLLDIWLKMGLLQKDCVVEASKQ
jgi:hypothetical protein